MSIPTKETRDEWRQLAKETMLISAVGEYTTREFTTLLDAVDQLERELQQATAELQAAKDWILNDSKTIGQLRAELARVTAERETWRASAAQYGLEADNWKVRAEEMDGYKADCMALRARNSELKAQLDITDAARRASVKREESLTAERDAYHRKACDIADQRDKAEDQLATLRARLHESEQDKRSGDEVITALRARVAELEQSLKIARSELETSVSSEVWRAGKRDYEFEKTRAEQAEQRNAELVAALREMVDAQDATVEQFTEPEIVRLEKAMRQSRVILARAESATPAKHDMPPRFHCSTSRIPISEYLRDYANAIDIGENQEDAQHAQWLRKAANAIEATPASEPTYHVPQSQLLPAYRGNTPAKQEWSK